MFKLEHPANLISRMFILEYMREIGAKALYEKAKPEQRKAVFYKFSTDDGFEDVDINWEACLFDLSILQLEGLLSGFMREIEDIEAKRQSKYKQKREEIIEDNLAKPADINLLSFAKSQIEGNKGKLLDANGNSFN